MSNKMFRFRKLNAKNYSVIKAGLIDDFKLLEPKMTFNFIHNFFNTDFTDSFKKVKKPVLIVEGTKDHFFPPRITKKLGRILPKSKYIEVPDSTHYMIAEDPDILSNIICNYLGYV